MKITSHILDTGRGCAAAGVEAILFRIENNDVRQEIGRATTNADGRITDFKNAALTAGHYQIEFRTKEYFTNLGVKSFYPKISVEFIVEDCTQHFHIPLLLNAFGYSTYRGT